MIRRLIQWLLCVAVLSHAASGAEKADLFGTNLIQNCGFETTENSSVTGWKFLSGGNTAAISADPAGSLTGACSLKISLLESGTSGMVISAPAPVTPGASYLFSISFRQEGVSVNQGGRYAFSGVSASALLTWLDEKATPLPGAVTLQFPYMPTPWDIGDAIVLAPATAKFARVQVSMSNQSKKASGTNIPSVLWLDAVQLREYAAPPTPEWATAKAALVVDGYAPESEVKTFFPASDSTWRNTNGQWSKSITDDKTERGGALKAEVCGSNGIMAHSPYYAALPPGLYRVVARVAVAAGSNPAKAGYIDVPSQRASRRALLDIVPKDFPVPGEYRNVEKDFLIREDGWWSLRAYTEGKEEWRIDSIRVFPLAKFSDTELIEVFPGCEGSVPEGLQPLRRDALKALVLAGVGWDTFKLPEILRSTFRDVAITPVWLEKGSGYALKGWPESPEALFQNNIIILSNIPSTALSIRQKSAIREYVRRGGALLIMGGHLSFERSMWKGSLLDELIPVELATPSSEGLTLNNAGWPIELSPSLPWVADYDAAIIPMVYALHRSAAKPGTEILASANGFPFLCSRKYGKGTVISCLGAPFGSGGAKGGVPFWQWDNWIYLIRDTLYHAVAPEKLVRTIHSE